MNLADFVRQRLTVEQHRTLVIKHDGDGVWVAWLIDRDGEPSLGSRHEDPADALWNLVTPSSMHRPRRSAAPSPDLKDLLG